MDRREAPRIGPPRRLAMTKIGRAGVFVAAVAGLLVVGGWNVSNWLIGWYHRRPEHRIAFREIALIPPPPPWLRIGREGLLDQVRKGRKPPEILSYLDLNLDQLLTDFRLNPWISRVDQATKSFPKSISVHLAYRVPVAQIHEGSGRIYLVDREGVVLLRDDVERSWADGLVAIDAGPPPTDPEPGLAWPGDDLPGKVGAGTRVAQAARLAGFLRDRIGDDLPASSPIRPRRIIAAEPKPGDPAALWVALNDPKILVLWGTIRNLDSPGDPTSDEKWGWLVAKAGDLKVDIQRREYLAFNADGIVIRRTPATSGPQ